MLSFLRGPLSHPYKTTVKTVALTRWTFDGKIMYLRFNMQSRLVIAFLPKSKCLLISWLQSPSAVILEPRIIKSAIIVQRPPGRKITKFLDKEAMFFEGPSFEPSAKDIDSTDNLQEIWVTHPIAPWKVLKHNVI